MRSGYVTDERKVNVESRDVTSVSTLCRVAKYDVKAPRKRLKAKFIKSISRYWREMRRSVCAAAHEVTWTRVRAVHHDFKISFVVIFVETKYNKLLKKWKIIIAIFTINDLDTVLYGSTVYEKSVAVAYLTVECPFSVTTNKRIRNFTGHY